MLVYKNTYFIMILLIKLTLKIATVPTNVIPVKSLQDIWIKWFFFIFQTFDFLSCLGSLSQKYLKKVKTLKKKFIISKFIWLHFY